MQAIPLDNACQSEAGGRWGPGDLFPENVLGPRPLKRRKMPFWSTGEHCCHRLSLSSKVKLIPLS